MDSFCSGINLWCYINVFFLVCGGLGFGFWIGGALRSFFLNMNFCRGIR